tara:strand:+ start:11073 stop:12527 length:1455 start_codon:yes stop_codon:yes gene_type:complete
MIGKAIYKILKSKISDLATGGIYPNVVPQNVDYPVVVYHNYNDPETSKDDSPNILYNRLTLQIIAKSYKEVEILNTKIRDVLDIYVDKTSAGLAEVPGYYENGNNHSFIGNVDISHIFYQEEEDDYFDKLEIYTKRVEYDVYYYYDIIRLSYDLKNSNNKTPTNPLMLCCDFTQVNLMRDDLSPFSGGVDYDKKLSDNSTVVYSFNKLGTTKNLCINPATNTFYNDTFYSYLRSSDVANPTYMPKYQDGIVENTKPFLYFSTRNNLMSRASSQIIGDNSIFLPYGAMFIMVYKPVGEDGENYILGNQYDAVNFNPILLSHKKVGSTITIHFNPHANSFTGASRERTLINSTDDSKYWVGDYHFLCLSLGGSKNYTGGNVNQAGWYEYFNSNYNPKLTTGQILQDNLITGNTDNMESTVGSNFSFKSIGHAGISSKGFRMYEFLMFIPNEAQTHNKDEDTAPFQPTDIIYKKVKEYIYNKYEQLK